MSEELRFDDLRADMNQRFAEVGQRFAEVNQRFGELREDLKRGLGDLRADMNQRFGDLNHRLTDLHSTLRIFMWVVSGWFTLLTAVLAVFGFFRR